MFADPAPLGARLFSFAVISDTHVNPDEDACNSPFPVNLRANRRFRHVIADINEREVELVFHLGDLVHPVPGVGSLYSEAAAAYRSIASNLKAPIHHVPGNHDIGDTPISGGPTTRTTTSTIAAWTKEFGAQYQCVSHEGIKFVLLNAQLINSGLPDEALQREFAEAELGSAGSDRRMLLLHHPAYLCHPKEAPHYDNTDPPGRDWLLGLLARHDIEAMFSGHAHNFWYDRHGTTDFYLAPSTCFVRQDYSEMARARPGNDTEFGRNDAAKLGYLIVNVHEAGHSMQFVRTHGAELGPDETPAPASVLAPTPRENASPTIGFDLRQNWAEISEVAPSGGLDEFDRKQVRNDYHLLALIEMGVRDVRIPLMDLRDPVRRQRLASLCHLGLRPTLFSFGVPSESDLALMEESADRLVDWEMAIDWHELDAMKPRVSEAHERTGLPIYLSRMRSKADLSGGSTYFHVINHGFSPTDAEMLSQVAGLKDIGVRGAVFRLGNQEPVTETLARISGAVSSHGLLASVHLRVAGDNPALAHADHDETCTRVLEAIDAVRDSENLRVFCDTLVDNDRGYFVRQGVIDRTGNPNRLLEVVKASNATAGRQVSLGERRAG